MWLVSVKVEPTVHSMAERMVCCVVDDSDAKLVAMMVSSMESMTDLPMVEWWGHQRVDRWVEQLAEMSALKWAASLVVVTVVESVDYLADTKAEW